MRMSVFPSSRRGPRRPIRSAVAGYLVAASAMAANPGTVSLDDVRRAASAVAPSVAAQSARIVAAREDAARAAALPDPTLAKFAQRPKCKVRRILRRISLSPLEEIPFHVRFDDSPLHADQRAAPDLRRVGRTRTCSEDHLLYRYLHSEGLRRHHANDASHAQGCLCSLGRCWCEPGPPATLLPTARTGA